MIIARVFAATAIASAFVAWVVYLRADMVLSHYDARASTSPSLGHSMQELSHAGWAIADFVHEGNGQALCRVTLRTASRR